MASDKPVCGHCHIHIPGVKREKKTMNKTKIPPSLPPAKTLSTISRNHISSLKRKKVKMWSEKSLHGSKLCFQMHQTIVSKQRTHDWITLHRCSSQRVSVTLKEQRNGLHLRSHRTRKTETLKHTSLAFINFQSEWGQIEGYSDYMEQSQRMWQIGQIKRANRVINNHHNRVRPLSLRHAAAHPWV